MPLELACASVPRTAMKASNIACLFSECTLAICAMVSYVDSIMQERGDSYIQ